VGNSTSIFAYGRDAHPDDLSEEQQAFRVSKKAMLQVWVVGGTMNISYHL